VVALRSDLRGFWLFSAAFVAMFALAGLLTGDLASFVGSVAFGLLFGWLLRAAHVWWYGRNVVHATEEGVVDVRRGQAREVVPWEDVATVWIDGGNFWSFGVRHPEPGGVYLTVDRPIRAADTSYPTRRIGSCLIVRHADRLEVLAQGREALRRVAPAGVAVRD
jgi:hypothetical protein